MTTPYTYPRGKKVDYLVKRNVLRDATLDGNAGIPDFPWGTDPTAQQFANGLLLNGDRPCGTDLYVTQVAGTAITLAGGPIGRLYDAYVHTAINGIDITGGDAQTSNLNVENIVKDSITVSGGGNVFINVAHVSGGDRGFVVGARIIGFGLFADNHRVGFVFSDTSDGSQLIAPVLAGCWEVGALLQTDGICISHLSGYVPDANAVHPNPVGVQTTPGTCNDTISGSLLIGEGGTGFVVNEGERQSLNISSCGWVTAGKVGTVARLVGSQHQNTIVISGNGDGGTVLDVTNAQFNETTNIEIAWNGTATRILGDTGKANVTIREAK